MIITWSVYGFNLAYSNVCLQAWKTELEPTCYLCSSLLFCFNYFINVYLVLQTVQTSCSSTWTCFVCCTVWFTSMHVSDQGSHIKFAQGTSHPPCRSSAHTSRTIVFCGSDWSTAGSRFSMFKVILIYSGLR